MQDLQPTEDLSQRFFKQFSSSNLKTKFSVNGEEETFSNFEILETKCSLIDQHANEIDESVNKLQCEMENILKVSADCKFHANAACISAKAFTTMNAEPSMLAKGINYVKHVIHELSNWIFALTWPTPPESNEK